MRLSKPWVLGQILSNDRDQFHILGSAIPVHVLDTLSEKCLDLQVIQTFLEVCKCIHPDIDYYDVNKGDNASINSNINSVEVNKFLGYMSQHLRALTLINH